MVLVKNELNRFFQITMLKNNWFKKEGMGIKYLQKELRKKGVQKKILNTEQRKVIGLAEGWVFQKNRSLCHNFKM